MPRQDAIDAAGRVIQVSGAGGNTILKTGRRLMTRANALGQSCAAFDQSSVPICRCAFDQ